MATALIARLTFDYLLIGRAAGSSLLDMSPFEREERRLATDGGAAAGADRLATEPWLPHRYKWSGVTAIGVVGGLLAGYIWLRTGSVFLGYAISAMSLLFLDLGVEKIPVTHPITLVGSVGDVLAMPVFGSKLAAGALGTLGGVVGEVTQRVFYSHSDTHVDPPAMAIALVMLLVGVLYLVGLLPNARYLGL